MSITSLSTTLSPRPEQPEQQASSIFALEIAFDLWKAMVLKHLVELGIPDLLVDGPRTVEELATATRTLPDLLYRFLRAATSCGFIQALASHDLPPAQRAFAASAMTRSLCCEQPAYFLVRQFFADIKIDSWKGLTENLRTGIRAVDIVVGTSWWDYLDAHPQERRDFDKTMTAFSTWVDGPLVQAYPNFAQVNTVVDVGGGRGTCLRSILQAYPGIHGTLFDAPSVIAGAEDVLLQDAGVSHRCTCVAGNFLESMPVEADIYLFKNVMHDWDDAHCLRILQNVRYSALPGSTLLLAEILVPEENPPTDVAVLDLLMLIEPGGQQRTVGEFKKLFAAAGFTLTQVLPVAGTNYHLVEARVCS